MKSCIIIFDEIDLSLSRDFRKGKNVKFIAATVEAINLLTRMKIEHETIWKFLSDKDLKEISYYSDFLTDNWFNKESEQVYHKGVLIPFCSKYYFRWFFGNFFFFYYFIKNFL